MARDDADGAPGLGEVLRQWAGRGVAGRPAAEPPASAPGQESVIALACVVERTQALVRQLEAELQSDRAQMSARLERLIEENRRLQERLRERQGEGSLAEGPPPPRSGRVSPFRRGLRGL